MENRTFKEKAEADKKDFALLIQPPQHYNVCYFIGPRIGNILKRGGAVINPISQYRQHYVENISLLEPISILSAVLDCFSREWSTTNDKTGHFSIIIFSLHWKKVVLCSSILIVLKLETKLLDSREIAFSYNLQRKDQGKVMQSLSSVTNYFLVNLSVADLLVTLICMPNAAWRAYTDAYNFGSVPCKIFVYLQSHLEMRKSISVASSIFTITTMAIDRYLAIIRPFGLRYRCFNRTSTIIMIFALWTFSLILFLPNLWIAGLVHYYGDVTLCRMDYSNSPIPQDVIGVIWFIFMFAIPVTKHI
ncbi:hypothetical protein HUJ05_013122 [Dendroctonus ponderosae]|nr:hypothetical protein HUJ05_013122 [Dendroctonus ponderosae]